MAAKRTSPKRKHISALKHWSDNLKNVYVSPKLFFQKMALKGGFSEPFRFALFCELSAAVIAFIYVVAGIVNGDALVIQQLDVSQNYVSLGLLFVVAAFISAAAVFVNGAISHFFLKLFGGAGTYEGTFRVMAYLAALSILAALTSFSNVLVVIISAYGVILQIFAFQRVHKLSATRVTFAVLTPIVLAILFSIYVAPSIVGA